MVLPNPDLIDLQRWADSVVVSYPEAEIPALNLKLATWQEWGNSLLATSPFNSQELPRPNLFSNWREWAKLVQGILENQAS